jgi:rRNA maturation endonuclease Nob1
MTIKKELYQMPKVTMLFGEKPMNVHVNSEVVSFDAEGVAEVSSEAAEVFRGIPNQYEVTELTPDEEKALLKANKEAEAKEKADAEAAKEAEEAAAKAAEEAAANLTAEDIEDAEAEALEAANAPGADNVPAAPATPAPRKRTAPKASN